MTMNEKCEKVKDIDFDRLETKKMEYVEVKADLEKEQKLTQERIDRLNRKIYNEFMSINKMAEMYGLNQHMINPEHEDVKCCPVQQRESFFTRNKNAVLISSIVVLVLILALGISPTGGWWDVLQTSYVELLVDMFRMCAIGAIFVLIYNLCKK